MSSNNYNRASPGRAWTTDHLLSSAPSQINREFPSPRWMDAFFPQFWIPSSCGFGPVQFGSTGVAGPWKLDNASNRWEEQGRITVKGGVRATSWLAPAGGSLAWKMPGWSASVGEKLYLKLFLAYVSFTANTLLPPIRILSRGNEGMIPASPQIVSNDVWTTKCRRNVSSSRYPTFRLRFFLLFFFRILLTFSRYFLFSRFRKRDRSTLLEEQGRTIGEY